MAMTGAFIWVPLLVVNMKEPSSCFSRLSALSPRVNPGLKGAICSNNLSIKSPAKTEG